MISGYILGERLSALYDRVFEIVEDLLRPYRDKIFQCLGRPDLRPTSSESHAGNLNVPLESPLLPSDNETILPSMWLPGRGHR